MELDSLHNKSVLIFVTANGMMEHLRNALLAATKMTVTD